MPTSFSDCVYSTVSFYGKLKLVSLLAGTCPGSVGYPDQVNCSSNASAPMFVGLQQSLLDEKGPSVDRFTVHLFTAHGTKGGIRENGMLDWVLGREYPQPMLGEQLEKLRCMR